MKHYVLILIFFFITFNIATAQRQTANLKRQAVSLMNNGRYGEAIDLLNKYIAANAQEAEGYNLRGLSHEKRGIYQFAVLDFRRAVRLDPNVSEYKKNLERALRDWHLILYKQIEGYKREIAINPNFAFNYLEIGKCYRWLEEWAIAEEWYDQYLARDDNASPDEIIRYTEILSHTGSIVKGEKILKKYVDRYPDDWRLWSRYGYFTMWLGNYKNAEKAFLNALSFKPFFKEAQDGLDIARNEGYLVKQSPRSFEREYPIDRIYRLIKNSPKDEMLRLSLAEELTEAGRYEEAFVQLKTIKPNQEGTERFDALWTKLNILRETSYNSEIDRLYALLKANPLDRESTKAAADYLARLERYGEADEILSEYLELVPDDVELMILRAQYLSLAGDIQKSIDVMKILIEIDPFNKEAVEKIADLYAAEFDFDSSIEVLLKFLSRHEKTDYPDTRFKLAKYYAWNNDWEDAREYLDDLMLRDPDNLEYQLLRAQVSVWTVDANEFEDAEKYFKNNLDYDPSNLFALIGMATIKTWSMELPEAKEYIELARKVEPDNPIIVTAENFYNTQFMAQEDLEKLKIRQAGGELAQQGDCKSAIEKYKEYFETVPNPDRAAFIEYASLHICISDYDSAIEILTQLLDEQYEYDVAVYRAKAHLWNRDSLIALQEFKKLNEEKPDDFDVNLNLGDAYFMNKEYSDANRIYRSLLEQTNDNEERELLRQKIKLIPPSPFQQGLTGFINFILPYSLSLIPTASYYIDNQNLDFYTYGGKAEVGMLRYFTFGAAYSNTVINSRFVNQSIRNQSIASLNGYVYFYPLKYSTIGAGFGKLQIQNGGSKDIFDILIRYEKPEHYGLNFSYQKDDTRRVLYSPRLLGIDLDISSYILSGFYNYKKNLFADFSFRHNKISDGNKGNDFRIKLGKYFTKVFRAGYEFSFSDYALVHNLYYSPQDFPTHSLWGDYLLYNKNRLNVLIGGKIGYAPTVDFVISELWNETKYELFTDLFLFLRLGFSNSYRFDSSYRSYSVYFNVIWSFY